mgnify:CR=1 FL=1
MSIKNMCVYLASVMFVVASINLSAMASATPTTVDAVSSVSSPTLPSLPDEVPLDLPDFDNTLLSNDEDSTPPFEQPTIRGLISEEHRS